MGFAKKSYGQSFKEALIFAKQCLCNPRKIGSIYPSSPALGRAMVSFIENKQEDTVIELGPGTGSITKTLLGASINLDNFYACEISSVFVDHLRKHFPEIDVREGDASKLTYVFAELVGRVDCVISGLPLKVLPSAAVEKIIDQEYKILKPKGKVIQFTYDLRSKKSVLSERFKHVGSRIVTANFPPARVDAFIKE